MTSRSKREYGVPERILEQVRKRGLHRPTWYVGPLELKGKPIRRRVGKRGRP